MFHIGTELARRDEPVHTGVIGAGLFGTNLIEQLESTAGLHASVVADIDQEKAVGTLRQAGVDPEDIAIVSDATAANAAIASGQRAVLEAGAALVDTDIDVVVEATGLAEAGSFHAYKAIMADKHVVMATVEAETVVGPILAELATANDVTYSMAYGDQPALIVELIEWANTVGLEVVAAGKGNPYRPSYRHGGPDNIFERIGFPEDFVDAYDLNPRMYNSFYDGTKVAVEMCAVANAVGFVPDVSGMHLPTAEIPEIPEVLRPEREGGILQNTGVVETVSTIHPDGTPVERDIGFGVFIVTTAGSDRIHGYFDRYSGSGLYTASDGAYQLFHRPYHLPGVETGVSVANAALFNQATGSPRIHSTEVVAAAKQDLQEGEEIDGGGGSTVYGTLYAADAATRAGYVPFELLSGATVTTPISQDDVLTYDDVEIREDTFLWTLRQLQEHTT